MDFKQDLISSINMDKQRVEEIKASIASGEHQLVSPEFITLPNQTLGGVAQPYTLSQKVKMQMGIANLTDPANTCDFYFPTPFDNSVLGFFITNTSVHHPIQIVSSDRFHVRILFNTTGQPKNFCWLAFGR